MRIFIDEAGGFVVPPPTQPQSFSLVLALTVQSASEADLFYDFLRLRDDWPLQAVEIKGSTLDESQAAQIIDLACRYDCLVNFCAVNMATHGDQIVDDFRARQAAAITANLTPAHHENVISHLRTLAGVIRAMPNQLFIQAFLTILLVLEVVRETTLYYVQRQPKELGDIAWTIDRKSRTITQMEEAWSTLILPMGESHYAREPFGSLIGADYSHYYARYGITAETDDKKMASHLKWMREAYGVRALEAGKGAADLRRLLTEQREFLDSRASLGLQLADMLATILRRALNGRLQANGWENFGRLLVRKAEPGSSFASLGRSDDAAQSLQGQARNVCLALDARAKDMLLHRNS
ncbi:MAG: DUF3800 domain-containing protein [Candidatus Acidiferrales bacterium]